MFQAISRIYEKTKDASIVKNALLKGWITAEEYQEITGEDLPGITNT